MKFSIDFNERKEERCLMYDTNEHGFNMEPYTLETDIDLSFNSLDLMVSNKKVVQLVGFCGLGKASKLNFEIPIYKEGGLILIDNLKSGYGSYRINNEDLPIYINIETKWICIGYPEKEGTAVEFINNCIAVIDDNGIFNSLWLKPLPFPERI